MAEDHKHAGPRLSVVIPARDEAHALSDLVSRLSSTFFTESPNSTSDVEVIIVDDGSRDDTRGRLQLLLASHSWLRVIRHRRWLGQSAAIWRGVDKARSSWIATLDGDGQNDPADIPRLLQLAEEHEAQYGPVLVAGYRVQRRDSFARRQVSWFSNRLSATVLRHPVVDNGCGLKVFRREQFLQLPRFDHMHRFLPPLFMFAGAGIRSAPVSHYPRTHGRSHYRSGRKLIEAVVDVLGMFWLKARYLAPDGHDEVTTEPAGGDLTAEL